MNIFKVINGNIIHTKKETVNTGSKNFFKVQIEFDSSWEDYTKLRFVEFYQNKDNTHYKVKIQENGIAKIPIKVLKTNLPIYVGVVAENYDSSIIANTDFASINIRYGSNTNVENAIVVEEENGDLFSLFAPDTSIRYLRVRNNQLEYSIDNLAWVKVSSAISSGITEEEVRNIITEEVTPKISEIDNKLEEVESIAKGASVPLTFSNYEQLVTIFNNLPNNVYKEGQNANIITVGVPDLWIAYITEVSVKYEYTTDEALIEEMRASGSVQIGYYKFAELETQKVVLTDYYTKEEIDSGFVAKPTDTSGFNRVYGITTTGLPLMYNLQLPSYDYSEASKNSRNGLAQYRNGNLGCSLPLEDYHTANKKYVDGLIAGLQAQINALK